MDADINEKKYNTENNNIPKSCWNIKNINEKDSSINSVVVPTIDNRQNNTDFPSLKEASSKLNKEKETKKNKIVPPLLKKQSRKSVVDEIQILHINNQFNYHEYCSPIKKEFRINRKYSENTVEKSSNESEEDKSNKALVPYSPYANYQNIFMPPPYSSLYHYWWKIPRCGFDLINSSNSNDQHEQLKRLINIINDKDENSNDGNYNEQEIKNMLNILKTLNIKIGDITYDTSLYVNSSTLSKIKIKDIKPPNNKNHSRTKSKLVELKSIIPKSETRVENSKITHLEDIFKVFQGIKVTNGPSGKYTLLMHLLFFLTPRELCLMTRVCKSWRNELLNSKYSVDLWWNIWMNHIWISKAQKEKVSYDKYLDHSKSCNDLSMLISSRDSLLSSMSSLSLSNLGSGSSLDLSKMNKKLMFPWYHTITRAERKRGTKVWIDKAIEEYRKTEVRGFEVLNYSSSSDSISSSDSDENSPLYQRPEGRGKLTSEEKNESRNQYKIMGSKPKNKKPWTREKGLSKEWLLHSDFF